MAARHSCLARSCAWSLQRNGPATAQRLAVAPTRILYTVRSHTDHLRPEDCDVNPRLPRLEPCPDYGANRMASFSNCGCAAIIGSLPADFGAPSWTTYSPRSLTHTNGAE